MRIPQPLSNSDKKNKMMVVLFDLQLKMLSTTITITEEANVNVNQETSTHLNVLGMIDKPVQSYMYLHQLQACIENKTLPDGKLIHAHINQMGFMGDRLLRNTLLNMYVKCGSKVDARRVFDQMPERNACSWTVMIAAYSRYGFPEEALALFHQMIRTGLQPNNFTFASVLPACANSASPQQGEGIHANIIKTGFESDIVVLNSLIDMYAKCGSIEKARELFDKMLQRDLISWTTMITGYAQNGLIDEAFEIFVEMTPRNLASWNAIIAGFAQNGHNKEALDLFRQMDLRPDSKTFASVLPACTNLAALEQGIGIHAKIITSGFACNVLLVNALMDMYAKCGNLEMAREIFDKSCCLDVVSWNVIIAGYAHKGFVEEALKLFKEMPEKNVVSWNTMITGFAQNGFVDEAMKLFNGMTRRTAVSWNAMISGFTQNGHCKEVLKVFQEMQLAGALPDSKTFASVLSACTNLATLEVGMEIHGKIITSGFQPDIMVMNALIDMYAKCGSLETAYALFKKMHHQDTVSWNVMISAYVQNGLTDKALQFFRAMPQQNVVSWNTVIAGLSLNGQGEEALQLFQQMPFAGVKPDSKTFTSILPACSNLAALQQGIEIHAKIVTSGFQSDVFVITAVLDMYAQCGSIEKAWQLFQRMQQQDLVSWNAMITGYAKNGLVDKALIIFKEMHQRNTVSWNAMIAGLAQNGHGDQALKFFQQMQLEGMRPDSTTFTIVLAACANMAALEQGKEIHENIIRSRLDSDNAVMNSLIDMYAKCGSIQKARELFKTMHHPDIISWNAMIGGYAVHGCSKEALKLFEQMKHSSMIPDRVTLISILSACSHAGLVDEGHQHFNSMSKLYNLVPSMEHYICMVDLLGRAGHVDEAQDFINKMPINPDVTIWSCLLGACRIHNNIEIAESLAEHLFELDPKNTAPYVLLSNIYATAGRWDGIEKIRRMMKDRGVKKRPGCSWIEVNKEVHAFLIGDRLSLQM